MGGPPGPGRAGPAGCRSVVQQSTPADGPLPDAARGRWPLAIGRARGYTAANSPIAWKVSPMSEVTRILSAVEQGDPSAAEQLLPLVYEELRKLAASKLAHEKPGQTLEATALVHEAYLRLIGPADANRWRDRGHFFAAAAEAMRRIL